jgi:hypothetical protein
MTIIAEYECWSNQAKADHQPCIVEVSCSLAKRRSCVIRHLILRHHSSLHSTSKYFSSSPRTLTYHNFHITTTVSIHSLENPAPRTKRASITKPYVRVEPFQLSFHNSVWNHGRNTRSRQYADIRFRPLRTLSSGYSSCQADLDQDGRATIGIG